MGLNPNWELKGFGNKVEIIFVVLYALYSIGTYFLMNTAVAKPMKLISIFIHEMGQ